MVPEETALKRLLGTSAVLLISYVFLGFVKNWNTNIPLFLSVYLLSFAVYLLCLYWLFQGRFEGVYTLYVFVPALLFRFAVLWCEPSLSEDFYRYRWDGKVQVAGHSPYDFPPRAPELQPLRDEYYDRINHKEFQTPYSTVAETLFHLFARVSTNVIVFKSFLAIFDLFLLEIIRRLLQKEKKSAAWLLVYAWHPLPIIEFAGGGHMDVIGISLLFLSYLLLYHRQAALSGITFAAAVLTKYLPALVLPWLLKQGKWKFVITGATAGLFLLLAYYSPDWKMFSGVLSYYKKWRFNDSLFGFLYLWLGGAEPARIAGMLFTVLAAGFCLAAKFSFYRSAFVIFGTVILFSPVVHPWYLCWVLPLLVFHPNKPWLFLCGWISLAYLVRHLYPVGVWKPILWLKLLIYVPFYAWLVVDVLRSLTMRKAASVPNQ
jgi:alpha-1,6-mannosyltransferase